MPLFADATVVLTRADTKRSVLGGLVDSVRFEECLDESAEKSQLLVQGYLAPQKHSAPRILRKDWQAERHWVQVKEH